MRQTSHSCTSGPPHAQLLGREGGEGVWEKGGRKEGEGGRGRGRGKEGGEEGCREGERKGGREEEG